MASIPHFYSNYTFTSDLSSYPTQGLASLNGNIIMENNNNNNNIMWGCQDSLFPVFDNGALDQICDTMSSSVWMPNFSEQLDFAVPATISDSKMGYYGGAVAIAGLQNFNNRYQQPHHVGDHFGDEFVDDVKPTSAYNPNVSRDNWGIQGNQIQVVEEPNVKVGRYSEEERKERILRYLKKRNQRNFNKTIKYACRKTLADRRVRVRGRFARNNEICEEEMNTKKNEIHHHHHHHNEDFYGVDSLQYQLKYEDEDWLQEAMASLAYLSHSSPDEM